MTTRSLATGAVASAIVSTLSGLTLVLLTLLHPDQDRFGSFVVPVVILCAAGLTMMIFLALYMYRDARARGMNGWLAVLLLLVSGAPGLVIYLLVRSRPVSRIEPNPPGGEPLAERSR